ncbi:hypothetical protein AGLY_014229 [Aphis glycines]|uniref:Uncharacterized protein n=1 Tax=Aphis glycines TaxID=307491 RepID=A0A6G0T483_APHGL|nr:hypothetical protein AGLY_014229 [Aphis glycines]
MNSNYSHLISESLEPNPYYTDKWVLLSSTLGAVWIIISVKFEFNDRYHCIRKTILNEDDLSPKDIIYLVVDEKGGLCFNGSNTPKFNFQVFFGQPKLFYRHFKNKNSQKVFELQPYKKIDLVENWFCVKIPVFPSLFFLFFSRFLKTVGKCLLLTCIMHQGYSLFHRKSPLMLEIEELFRLVMLYTDTKTKKTKNIIVKSIHSSLRLESKNVIKIKSRTPYSHFSRKMIFLIFNRLRFTRKGRIQAAILVEMIALCSHLTDRSLYHNRTSLTNTFLKYPWLGGLDLRPQQFRLTVIQRALLTQCYTHEIYKFSNKEFQCTCLYFIHTSENNLDAFIKKKKKLLILNLNLPPRITTAAVNDSLLYDIFEKKKLLCYGLRPRKVNNKHTQVWNSCTYRAIKIIDPAAKEVIAQPPLSTNRHCILNEFSSMNSSCL